MTDHQHSTAHARGFHGPKCWVLSAILGLALGFVASLVLPAKHTTPSDSGHAAPGGAHELVRVLQIEPGGERVERLSDLSTRPWADAHGEDGALGVDATNGAQVAHGGHEAHSAHHDPVIPLWLCAPFALLLGSIALMPFINQHFWHHHYPDFAFFLGAAVLAYYLSAFGHYGSHAVMHVAIEYYAFIALVGGLFIASGGILIDIRARGHAGTNTALLALGCVLANVVGTTGASMLLIRPFLRMNEGRMRPLHAVFFIFIVSNCAGCLTPIGDPPLYLGFLKGVPFEWTLTNLWPMWLMVNAILLAMFFVYDLRVPRAGLRVIAPEPGERGPTEVKERVFDPSHRGPIIVGWPALGFLSLLVAGVFVDPLIKRAMPGSTLAALPVGATFQIAMAICAFVFARPSVRHANGFNFEPVKEVGFLFFGIFLTMAPALGYLQANASKLGVESPTQFYFATGVLSAVLDNAPTYASFLQAALGVLHLPMNPAGIETFIRCSFDVIHVVPATATAAAIETHVRFEGATLLRAISLGAVFFGAMTYIGNGPNFMVRAIVESARAKSEADGGKGVRMPSFFGYALYATAILFPVLIINWLVWIR